MMISAEYLSKLRADAVAQREKLVASLHQANGAVAMLDALIAVALKPEEEPAEEAE